MTTRGPTVRVVVPNLDGEGITQLETLEEVLLTLRDWEIGPPGEDQVSIAGGVALEAVGQAVPALSPTQGERAAGLYRSTVVAVDRPRRRHHAAGPARRPTINQAVGWLRRHRVLLPGVSVLSERTSGTHRYRARLRIDHRFVQGIHSFGHVGPAGSSLSFGSCPADPRCRRANGGGPSRRGVRAS